MKIHDSHYIAATWFKGDGFHVAGRVAVGFERCGGLTQTLPALGYLSHSVDGVQQIPSFYAAGGCRRQRQVAG
jgi:hypothetical protein